MVLKDYIHTIAVYFYAYCPTSSGKNHCILYQNTLRFAPKRVAFSTKTQAILHQNAPYLVANYPKSGVNDALLK